jgi:hypothetical protein
MAHVFISYSRHDREFADRLVHDLSAAGVKTWRDIDNLVPGVAWEDEIRRAIDAAGAVLVVLTPNFLASEWVLLELEIVQKRVIDSIPLIPILYKSVDVDTIPRLIANIQWADFATSYDRGLESLLESLRAHRLLHSQPFDTPTPKSRGYFFISYAEEDTSFVSELRDFMAERGYGYFDWQLSDRNYHTQFALELEAKIREASATLSIISPDWKNSKWTLREYSFSEDIGVPIFVLRVRPVEPTLLISGVPYLDFTRDRRDGFKMLDRELARHGLLDAPIS